MTRGLADTAAIAVIFGVTPATIRQWARRGILTRAGRDGRRVLYAIAEAEQLLNTRRSRQPTAA